MPARGIVLKTAVRVKSLRGRGSCHSTVHRQVRLPVAAATAKCACHIYRPQISAPAARKHRGVALASTYISVYTPIDAYKQTKQCKFYIYFPIWHIICFIPPFKYITTRAARVAPCHNITTLCILHLHLVFKTLLSKANYKWGQSKQSKPPKEQQHVG